MKDQNHVQLRRLGGLAVLGVVMVLGVACGGSDSAVQKLMRQQQLKAALHLIQ